MYGFHPGTCKSGNAGGAWTQRSCVLEGALAYIACRVGVYAVQIGNANWFGAAGWDPLAKNGAGAYRKADVVFVSFFGGGSLLDVVVIVDNDAHCPNIYLPCSIATILGRTSGKVVAH